jgi:hypothetical protein
LRIAQKASTPLTHAYPSTRVFVGLGFTTAAILAVMLALLAEHIPALQTRSDKLRNAGRPLRNGRATGSRGGRGVDSSKNLLAAQNVRSEVARGRQT